MVRNPLPNMGSISGWGKPPGGGHGKPISVVAWRLLWTEKPGGLQFMGSHRVGYN